MNPQKVQSHPAPIITCLGAMADVNKALSYDLKQSNSILLMVGERKDECGGSVYYQLHNATRYSIT